MLILLTLLIHLCTFFLLPCVVKKFVLSNSYMHRAGILKYIPTSKKASSLIILTSILTSDYQSCLSVVAYPQTRKRSSPFLKHRNSTEIIHELCMNRFNEKILKRGPKYSHHRIEDLNHY
jgi:hypothetical protein